MKIQPIATWTTTIGTLVLAMIALVSPVHAAAQTRGSRTTPKTQTSRPAQTSQSTHSAQPARPSQPAPAARTSTKDPATDDAKPAREWTKKTGEGEPDLQGFWSARSSVMIVEPEGSIPPLSEEGLKREAALAAKQASMQGHADQAEDQPLTGACMMRTLEGPPLISTGPESNLQIIQGEGYVMIVPEMIHNARLIPLGDRPHLSSDVTQWTGDSRGHWEGDTLVVETTNYNGRNLFQGISSDKLKVTERFTRLNEGTLQYEFTIDDPVWTRPWTAIVSWARTDGPLLEHACHEGMVTDKRLFPKQSAPGEGGNTKTEK